MRSMIRLRWLHFVALFLFATALVAPARAAHRGFVHTDGPKLVDAQNHPLYLRGINLGNWFETEGYMFHFDHGPQSTREIEELANELLGPTEAAHFWHEYRNKYITRDDIQFLRKAGFNSVRIPI